MFIVFEGECGVYKPKGKRKLVPSDLVHVVKEGHVVGEGAIDDGGFAQEEKLRSASIICHSDLAITLCLTKTDYISILEQHRVMERMSRQKQLVNLPFFKAFPDVKLVDFNATLQTIDLK